MRLGLLGGGQLARMLALAAHPLGIEVSFLDPSAEACAAPVARQVLGDWDDEALLDSLARQVDVISFEFENVPSRALEYLAAGCQVWPPALALTSGQDRLLEKRLFDELGIPVAPYAAVASLEELEDAVARIGLPAMLKSRRQGYDGKGQALVRDAAEAKVAWRALGERPCLLESLVAFEREVSIIAVRSQSGEIRAYAVSENLHRQGILIESIARPDDPVQAVAEAYVGRLLTRLDYVGVLALELFQVPGQALGQASGQTQPQLLANEFAPRVHNSGHWTQEGAETSQFENHVRAVCGLPLGSTQTLGWSAMHNCIGQMPDAAQVLAIPGAHLHDYAKLARPGRKLGHINLRARDPEALAQAQERLRRLCR